MSGKWREGVFIPKRGLDAGLIFTATIRAQYQGTSDRSVYFLLITNQYVLTST